MPTTTFNDAQLDTSPALFEITRRGPRENKSVQMPAFACVEGVAMQESEAVPGVAELANGIMPFGGFVNRPVVVGVPPLTPADYVTGLAGPLETPYQAGYEGSLEDADEVVAEGADYMMPTGGDAITGATVVKTKCSFRAGRFCVAQTGQRIEYVIIERLTPVVAGNTRLRFKKVTSSVA